MRSHRADRRALPEGALVATLKRLDVLCGQRGDIYAVKHRDHHVLQRSASLMAAMMSCPECDRARVWVPDIGQTCPA